MGDLRLNDRGPQVEALQNELNLKLTPSPVLFVDGDYGSATFAAVVAFQKQAGIDPANGVATVETQEALARATLPPRVMRPWMDIAREQIRDQKLPGRRDAYYDAGGVMEGSDWCSAFINWVMGDAGYEPTHSGLAQSWTQWGDACEPRAGAIVVLYDAYFDHPSFPNNPWPHVALVEQVEKAATSVTRVNGVPVHLGVSLKILGGNQGDAVSIISVPSGPNCAYPPYIAGAAFRWPSLADLKLVRQFQKLARVFIPQRGSAPQAPGASVRRIAPPKSDVVLGEEDSFGPYDEGARCRTDRENLTGIKAKLRLPIKAGAGDGDYTYFNFYLGMGKEVEAGISFTINNPKFKKEHGITWRRFINPGGPSLLFSPPPWGEEVSLLLEFDAAGMAHFSVNGTPVGSVPVPSGATTGAMKMVMAVHNGPNQYCWYAPAQFDDVQVRERNRKTWTPWTSGSTGQITPRGKTGQGKPEKCMTITKPFPLGTYLLPHGVRDWVELDQVMRRMRSVIKAYH